MIAISDDPRRAKPLAIAAHGLPVAAPTALMHLTLRVGPNRSCCVMGSISGAAHLREVASSVLYPTAPPFTAQELHVIAEWSVAMRRIGVSTEFYLGHLFLTEALHIAPTGADEPSWIVHKTPDGAVAMRPWPGLADIVPTMDEALSAVARAMSEVSFCGFPGASG